MMLAKDTRHATLLPEVSDALSRTIHSFNVPKHIRERAQIIILNSNGLYNNQIAKQLCCHENTVSKWICRFRNRLTSLNELVMTNRQRTEGQSLCSIEGAIENILSDKPRSGRPEVFGLEVRFFIVWICCHEPSDFGFENNIWHLPQIQKAVKLSEIVDKISIGGVYSILMANNLCPWKNKYYLYSKDRYENNEFCSSEINNTNLECSVAQNQRRSDKDEEKFEVLFVTEPLENIGNQQDKGDELSVCEGNQLYKNTDAAKKISIDPTALKKCAEKVRNICKSSDGNNIDLRHFLKIMMNERENL